MNHTKKRITFLILLGVLNLSVKAQKDTVTIQFLGTDTITEQVTETKTVKKYKLDESKIISRPWIFYSNDGETCIKAGHDYVSFSITPLPSMLEFYYKGKLVKTIDNEYKGFSINTSTDGYVALVGVLLGKPKNDYYLTVYTPQGEQISQTKLDSMLFSYDIKVSPQAKYIALHPFLTTDIIVFNQKGEEVLKYNTKSGYKNFTFLDNKYLVVCSGFFLVFNLETMKNIVKFESINPDVYALDTYNNYLIGIDQIHMGYDEVAKKDKYFYNLYIISLEAGKSIAKISLPGKYYSAPKGWKIIIENENQFYLS